MDNSTLKDIGIYKNKLISLLLSSKEICDSLLQDGYTEQDVDNLIYTQIFPYLYIDDVQTEVRSYICADISIPIIPNGTIKKCQLTIWTCVHKDSMRYLYPGYVGTKPDIIADMIDRLITNDINCRKFGIGKAFLTSVGHFLPQTNYYGRELKYTLPDFKVKDI